MATRDSKRDPFAYHGSLSRGGYTSAERDALPKEVFLKPESRSWPVGDLRHAEIAIQYMKMGRGRRNEYPRLLKRLAEIWSPQQYPNLWAKVPIELRRTDTMAPAQEAKRNYAAAVAKGAAAGAQAIGALWPVIAPMVKKKGADWQKEFLASDAKKQIKMLRKMTTFSMAMPGGVPLRLALANDTMAEKARVAVANALQGKSLSERITTATNTIGAVKDAASSLSSASQSLIPEAAHNPTESQSMPGVYLVYTKDIEDGEESFDAYWSAPPWSAALRQALIALEHSKPKDYVLFYVTSQGERSSLDLNSLRRAIAEVEKRERAATAKENKGGNIAQQRIVLAALSQKPQKKTQIQRKIGSISPEHLNQILYALVNQGQAYRMNVGNGDSYVRAQEIPANVLVTWRPL